MGQVVSSNGHEHDPAISRLRILLVTKAPWVDRNQEHQGTPDRNRSLLL
jgi:hypothetical protein